MFVAVSSQDSRIAYIPRSAIIQNLSTYLVLLSMSTGLVCLLDKKGYKKGYGCHMPTASRKQKDEGKVNLVKKTVDKHGRVRVVS